MTYFIRRLFNNILWVSLLELANTNLQNEDILLKKIEGSHKQHLTKDMLSKGLKDLNEHCSEKLGKMTRWHSKAYFSMQFVNSVCK
jgi:hypothetical protein